MYEFFKLNKQRHQFYATDGKRRTDWTKKLTCSGIEKELF